MAHRNPHRKFHYSSITLTDQLFSEASQAKFGPYPPAPENMGQPPPSNPAYMPQTVNPPLGKLHSPPLT